MRPTLSALVLVVAAVAGGFVSCGGDGSDRSLACSQAIEQWNSCASQDRQQVFGVPQLEWNGPCQDGVEFNIGAGQRVTVDLATWAQAYVSCRDVMPFTCMCPGLPFLTPTYDPPKTCDDFTPAGVVDVCKQHNSMARGS